MISFDDFGAMLDEIALELPKAIYIDLNGGINLLPDIKIHPQSYSKELVILGEYHTSRDLGRYINIYYGSFMQSYSHLNHDQLRNELTKTLKHEFVHHLESMAGERDLEIEDARLLLKYKQSRKNI